MSGTAKPLHPLCQVCNWRKGGPDSWDGKACKCGHSEPPMPQQGMEAITAAVAQTDAMSETAKHAPTPWYINPCIETDEGLPRRMKWHIHRRDGAYSHPATAHNEHDAAFIVRACNSHDALVAALEAAIAICEAYDDSHLADNDEEPVVAPVIKQGHDALAKAKEQGK